MISPHQPFCAQHLLHRPLPCVPQGWWPMGAVQLAGGGGGGLLQWGGGEEQCNELEPCPRLPPGSLPWATHMHMDIYAGWERIIHPCSAMCLLVHTPPKSHTDPTRIKRLGRSQNKYFTVNY